MPTAAFFAQPDVDGWYSLFSMQDLSGCKSSEHTYTFRIEGGKIVMHGHRGHLLYVGPVHDGDFANFQSKCDVLMKPGSNFGIYFHIYYQEEIWPSQRYAVQLNNSNPAAKEPAACTRCQTS